MPRYVVITDDPARIRALHNDPADWTERRFATAAEALAWERGFEASGYVALEGQGFTWGVTFSEADCRHGWVGHRVA